MHGAQPVHPRNPPRRFALRPFLSPVPLLSSLRRRLGATRPAMQDWPGLIEGYRKWLPVSDKTPVITLREGATP